MIKRLFLSIFFFPAYGMEQAISESHGIEREIKADATQEAGKLDGDLDEEITASLSGIFIKHGFSQEIEAESGEPSPKGLTEEEASDLEWAKHFKIFFIKRPRDRQGKILSKNAVKAYLIRNLRNSGFFEENSAFYECLLFNIRELNLKNKRAIKNYMKEKFRQNNMSENFTKFTLGDLRIKRQILKKLNSISKKENIIMVATFSVLAIVISEITTVIILAVLFYN